MGATITARAQLSGTLSVPSATYPTIASVVSALNTQGVGTGGVTVNVAAGYTETLTATLSLTATGTPANPIIFQKSGTGANPLITAYANASGTATAASATPDGIWNFVGSDYVTINAIDLAENSTNNTAAAAAATQAAAAGILMEYGYALFKASATDGAQHNTIKNCTVTLNRLNWTAAGAGPLFPGAAGIEMMNCTPTATQSGLTVTAASGGNSYNAFYSNTVQNCNVGIALSGYAAASPYTLADTSNDIGGSSAATGNTVINFGGGAGATQQALGIAVRNQWNFNVSYNTVNSNNGSGVNHQRMVRGIFTTGGNGTGATINNNTVTIAGGGTTQDIYAIDMESGTSATSSAITVNNNTLQASYTTATSGSVYGIYLSSTATTLSANNNTISSLATSSSSGLLYGIYNSAAPANLSLNNNSLSSFSFGAANSGGAYFLYNGSTIGTSLSINSNTIQNSTNLNTTGDVYFIYNSNSTATYSVAGNTCSNISRISGSSGTFYGFYNNGGGSGTATLNNNVFNNITAGSSSGFYGLYSNTSNSQNINYVGNKLTNITTGSGTSYMIYNGYGTTVNINNDTINNISAAGTLYGIFGGGGSTSNANVFSNLVNTLATSGSSVVYGIYMNAANSSSSTNIAYKNKVYDISASNAGGKAYGMYLNASGANHTAYNNLIGDIKAPAATDANAVVGLYINAPATANVYNNTVYLSATSSGTTFGSSALYVASTTPTVTLRNNILVNNSTPGSASGFTAAFRYTSAPGTKYAAASNNNLFYAGTPGASRLIYGEGTGATATNGQQSLGAYQGYIGPIRDSMAVTENPGFASTTGSAANYLHFSTGTTTAAESNGRNVTSITDDYDGDIRQGNTGYAGSGTQPDIGADEFGGVNPLATINTVTITPAGAQCTSVARTVTANITPGAAAMTAVVLNYSINGAAQTPITMTGGNLAAASNWTATIPSVTPANATIVWYVTAVSGSSFRNSTARVYIDAPLTGYALSATANPSTICAGAPTNLSVLPSATTTVTNYDVTSIPYSLTPTPGTGVTTLASGGSAVTSQTSGSLDDGYWTVTLPFSFNLYGTAYTAASIGTNGSVMFSSPVNGGYNNAWPTTTDPKGAFAPLFGDLTESATGTVNYFVTGSAPNRVFVVNWTGVNWYSATPSASFQAKLYEGTNILETHITSTTGGNNHLVSVQNAAGTVATTPSSRALGTWAVSTPEAWRFSPQLMPNSTFLWTPNGTNSGIATGAETSKNPVANPVNTTTYTVTMTDSNGCTTSANVTVTTIPLAAGPTATNSVQCGVGVPTASVSGGTGVYKWYTAAVGGTLLQRGGSTYTGSVSTTTTFYVADSAGTCETTRTPVKVTVTTPDQLTINTAQNAICTGAALSMNVTKTGTANNYTYTWTAAPATGSGITGTVTGSSTTVTPTVAGTYVYTVTGVDGSCAANATKTITVNPLPNVNNVTATPNAVCSGTQVALAAQSINAVSDTVGVGIQTTSDYTGGPYREGACSGNKAQYLFTAAELTSAGLQPGNITALAFKVTSLGSGGAMGNYTINIAPTTATSITNTFISTAGTTVYGPTAYTAVSGINTHTFTTPFAWNGTSNIVVTICHDNLCTGSSSVAMMSATNKTVYDNSGTTSNCSTTSGTSGSYRPIIVFSGQVGTNVTSAMTWQWNPGAISGNTVTVTPTNTGTTQTTVTYTAKATNTTTGCFNTGTVNVTVYPLPATPTATNSTQCGVGVPTASVSGGTGIYKWYSSSTGGTLLQRGGSTYTGTVSTTTTFYVVDSSGLCESARVPVTVTVNQPDSISAKANGNATPATICLGSPVNLTTVKVGTSNTYTYKWTANPVTGSNIPATGTAGQNITVTPTAAGTYVYTVTGTDFSCVAASAVTVNVINTFANAPVVTSVSKPVICAGDVDTLKAMITAPFFAETFETASFPLTSFVTGSVSGTPTAAQNTTYFSQGSSSVLFNTNSASADVSMSTANSIDLTPYTSAKLTFSHIAALEGYLSTFDIGYVQYSTNGGSSWTTFPASSYAGSGTLVGTGVSFSTLSYTNWTNTLTGATTTPTNSLWQNETINIPAAALSSNQFKIRFRITTDGSVYYYGWLIDNVQLTGTSFANVSWSNGTTVVGTANPQVVTPTTTTTYTPTVTYNGCSTVATPLAVTVNPLPVATITPSAATAICAGNSIVLTATTGTGYTYQWKLNGNNISGATNSTYTATAAGSYTVVVTSINCSSTSTATVITVTPLPAATITAAGPTTVCTGSSVTLNANTGTGLTYTWKLNGNPITGASNANYTATATGAYTVTVTSNGCSVTSTAVNVSVLAPPTAVITAQGATTFCQGDSVLLAANTGTGLTYVWKRNGTAIPGATNSTRRVLQAGTYTVDISNGGCVTTSNSVVITVNPLPTVAISASGPTAFCDGGSVVLHALPATGLTYTWKENGSPIAGATNANYTATQTGLYTVTVSNGSCTNTATPVTVTVFPLPTATITALTATTICANDTAVLEAPGGFGYTYQWYLNGNAIVGANSQLLSTNTAGNYTVKVTTANGCTATSATAVTINTFVAPNTTVSHNKPLAICLGDNVILSVSSGQGYTYQWYRNGSAISGATNVSYTVVSLAGVYTVRVTTPNGCTGLSTDQVVIVLPLVYPIISINGNTLSTSGFTNYQWYLNNTPIPGATDSSYTVTQNGYYTVLATAPNGCATMSAIASIQFLGIETVKAEMVKIYPNPSASKVYIDAPRDVNIALCAVDGRVLEYVKKAKQIDVSNYADGVYMIRVLDENDILVKIEKLIKASR